MLIQIPPEFAVPQPNGLSVTLGDILLAAGIDVALLHSAAYYGTDWQPAGTLLPYLQHPLPVPPVIGVPVEIAVLVTEPVPQSVIGGQPLMTVPEVAPVPQVETAETGPPEDHHVLYDRLESSWKVSVQMERQMSGLRQKLTSMMGSLSKLDRDLTPDERVASDREDRDAWHDARRWIRDLTAKCHREVKSFDIGMTSAAGKRTMIEQYYLNVVKPRVPSSDLKRIQREFEVYRKDITNLQQSMNHALQSASQNGTQRAQRILGTIQRKIKARRAKMREAIGGTNLDKTVRRKS